MAKVAAWLVALGAALAIGSTTTACNWVQDSADIDAGASVPDIDAGSTSATSDDAGSLPVDDAAPGPVDASSLDAGVAVAISAGGQHTCTVTSNGSVWCWGSNVYAELGSTVGIGSLVPVPVPQAPSSAAVAAGDQHTCALSRSDAGSEVRCWGGDEHGQLGGAGVSATPAAVLVPGLGTDVTAIAAGGFHTCAIASGDVWCWGDDADGQLGNGAATDSPTPVRAASLSGVTAITAGGGHTCALTSAGGVECWGFNSYGQVGNGTTTNQASPVPVMGLASGVAAIAAGNNHTCALTTSGTVQCWGFGFYGQLGNAGIASSSVPVTVTGLPSGASAIAAGGTHSCALLQGSAGGASDSTSAIWCWGDDQSGQLGNNLDVDSLVPVEVVSLASGATAITAGTAHTCALLAGGGAQCWGWNVSGQLGCDTNEDTLTPVSVCGL